MMLNMLRQTLRYPIMLGMRVVRGMTIGVRVIVRDGGSVLLVRHTYVDGWHFPGGGLSPGETSERGAIRELAEETGIAATATLRLVGVFFNRKLYRRDHVLLYEAQAWQPGPKPPGDLEIAETRFFALDALPADLSPGTARRLAELAGKAQPDGEW